MRDMKKSPIAGFHARWYMELTCQQGHWHVRANVDVSSNRAPGIARSAGLWRSCSSIRIGSGDLAEGTGQEVAKGSCVEGQGWPTTGAKLIRSSNTSMGVKFLNIT